MSSYSSNSDTRLASQFGAQQLSTPLEGSAVADLSSLMGVLKPFAEAADWEEKCIDADYGIARVRPLKDNRRVAVTLGECRAAREALRTLQAAERASPVDLGDIAAYAFEKCTSGNFEEQDEATQSFYINFAAFVLSGEVDLQCRQGSNANTSEGNPATDELYSPHPITAKGLS